MGIMRTTFLSFGDRLRLLMKKKHIKNATMLAEQLYTSGIMQYSIKQSKKESIAYTSRTINIHLKSETIEAIKGYWIKRYCDFFHCSADYFFGYISQSSHDQTLVYESFGIYPAAAEFLSEWVEYGNVENSPGAFLSYIITHPDGVKLYKELTHLVQTGYIQSLTEKAKDRLSSAELEEIDDIDGITQWRISKIFSRICDSLFQSSLDAGQKHMETHEETHWTDYMDQYRM